MSKIKINNLVVISDLHIGCKLGLCRPDGAELDDGGVYMPSRFQKETWGHWDVFWKEFVPKATNGEPWALVINGDAIDGVHHDVRTTISNNLQDQSELAYSILEPVVSRAQAYYHIRGTEAHSGKSGQEEERLAKRLGAVPNSEKQYARWDLWARVGEGLIHCLHHIGTTSSSAHEASAVNAELTAAFVEAARWGEEAPDMVVRSHRHRHLALYVSCARGKGWAVVTPGWQLKTPLAWKMAGVRQAPPQIGGIVIRWNGRNLEIEEKVWHTSRSRIEGETKRRGRKWRTT